MQPPRKSDTPTAPQRRRGRPLTDRQREVLAECYLHATGREAAACLGIAESTVRQTLKDVMAHTEARTIRQAPIALGWLDIPRGVVKNHPGWE